MCYAYQLKSASPQRHLVTFVAPVQPPAEEGGQVLKVCLCSPTSHPGSFRCRKHHGEYQWVNRLGSKPS
ncbi:hypothetical protein AAHA92_33120 [Salvia divinorum]|uniref:Uncharacterized protein n=1 Tax=Salvia divinorum TaxID=28513 RepID=A0ABD1FR10_SALDI